MSLTYQTRLAPSIAERRWLDASGELYGRCERKLYSLIARGTDAARAKSALMAEFGLTARQYNALRMSLQGKIDGTRELLTERKKGLQRDLRATRASLKRVATRLDEVARDTRRVKKNALELLRRQHYNKTVRLESLGHKLESIQRRLDAPVPGICFGSRKLFRQQFHLEEAGFASHAAWRRAWRAARNHQFFLVGSKDETAGNQSCKALVAADGTLTLQVRMAPALVVRGAPTVLELRGIVFPHGHDALLAALMCGEPQALTYRFHRDAKGWRVFVTLDVAAAAVKSVARCYGQVGVDFNEGHLAVTRTDRHGNLVESFNIALRTKHKTSEQREALLSDALDIVFAYAAKHSLGVALEDLDFQKKKAELKRFGDARYARMLSGLAYAKYRQLAQAKAARAGIELTWVDPAYTSVAGRVKYAGRLGLSAHQAAAGVVARRAQGYREKLPTVGTYRVPVAGVSAELALPERNRAQSPRASWAAISRKLAQRCADVARGRAGTAGGRRRASAKNLGGRSRHVVRSSPVRGTGTRAGSTVRPVSIARPPRA